MHQYYFERRRAGQKVPSSTQPDLTWARQVTICQQLGCGSQRSLPAFKYSPSHPRALGHQSKLLLLPSRQCPRQAHPAEHLAHLLRLEIFWRGTELREGKRNMEQSVTPICRCFASQLLAFRFFPSILPLHCWA